MVLVKYAIPFLGILLIINVSNYNIFVKKIREKIHLQEKENIPQLIETNR